jgi:hypothetical protein
MWLLLAGRALYITGVALHAALTLDDSGSSSSSSATPDTQRPQQQQQLSGSMLMAPATPNSTETLPQLPAGLPNLRDSILSLGSTIRWQHQMAWQ